MKPHHRKVYDEGRCRNCGSRDGLDPAHTIAKSLGGKMRYDSVIPLCRYCHDCSHGKYGPEKRIEMLPLMNEAEELEAVRVVGLGRAYALLTRGGS